MAESCFDFFALYVSKLFGLSSILHWIINGIKQSMTNGIVNADFCLIILIFIFVCSGWISIYLIARFFVIWELYLFLWYSFFPVSFERDGRICNDGNAID